MTSQSQPEYVLSKAVLERMHFYKSARINGNEEDAIGFFALDNFKGDVEYDILYNDFILRFESDLLAEHLADDYYEETLTTAGPSTVWDMFKETYGTRWWMRWWVANHPPKYTHKNHTVRVKVERWVKYPFANIKPDPRLGRAIPYERLERVYE